MEEASSSLGCCPLCEGAWNFSAALPALWRASHGVVPCGVIGERGSDIHGERGLAFLGLPPFGCALSTVALLDLPALQALKAIGL